MGEVDTMGPNGAMEYMLEPSDEYQLCECTGVQLETRKYKWFYTYVGMSSATTCARSWMGGLCPAKSDTCNTPRADKGRRSMLFQLTQC